MTFRPETRDLGHALSVAANALLHAMVAITRLFPSLVRSSNRRCSRGCHSGRSCFITVKISRRETPDGAAASEKPAPMQSIILSHSTP
jgi:hypothetical protein